MQSNAEPKKYIFVFLVTALLFAILFLFSDFLYGKRVAQIKNTEESISQHILATEIEYALLADQACDTEDTGGGTLVLELNALAKRLAYMEDQRGANDVEVISLKKYYSLLEVKDYLLLRERTRLCGEQPPSILYFYSNAGECTECKKMGYVLTSMREDYDKLHVYAFDYHLDLSVIATLKSIYKLDGQLPVLIIDRKPYYGFKTREEIEQLIPALIQSGRSVVGEKTK
jgi:hypothetical protein